MTTAVPSDPVRSPGAARRFAGRIPLRVKLTSALVALVTVALAVISIAGISVLKSYLLGQADASLEAFATEAPKTIQEYLLGAHPFAQTGTALSWVPIGGRMQPVIEPGIVYGHQTRGQLLPEPAVPTSASWLAGHDGTPLTVAAESGGRRWRVLAFSHSFVFSNGAEATGTVIVGLDVSSVYATIGHLISIDLIVSLIIILVLAIVGIALVRSSLRPLTEIEQTAEGIAAGDLTRRVPDRDPRTEVGRLGRSLNAMLSQIESAFRARAESETAARRSEERMRQFVADASHELRTPLTAIRGFAEYYRQRGGVEHGGPERGALAAGSSGSTQIPGGQVRDLPAHSSAAWGPLTRVDLDRIMRRVEQESSRMGILVEDMLLLARLDQQRPLENRPVDLLTLAADAVHDARVMAPRRSIDLTVLPGAAPIVLGDEVRLRQVIGNLMSNALIHTPDGTPVEVRIRPGTLDEGRGTASPAVILEVADRGPGLTPDQAERAFERFYRADQARGRQTGGTGLGLAIVSALVSAHGGTVTVDTEPGRGAAFRIALPLAPEAQGIQDHAEETPPPSQAGAPGGTGQQPGIVQW